MTRSFTYRDLFSREYTEPLAVTVSMFITASVLQHFATVYALDYSLRPTSTYVGDLLLDNLPIVDLNLLIVEGALLAIAVGAILVFLRPRYVLFSLKAVSLFIITRATFMSLTHVGIYPGQINPGPGFFDAIYLWLNFETGFFFSGHTGLPFLMALIFWDNSRLRNGFLLLSLVFAIAVLFAHTHYSIDVVAAPFIAYGIFHASKFLFARSYALIKAAP